MADPAQLNNFLASVEKRAYAMAYASVRNPDDALDIVQDTMMTLARKYSKKTVEEWPPLFFRILRNRITDFHRSATSQRRWFGWLGQSHVEDDDPLDHVPGSISDTPEHSQEMTSIGEKVSAALAQLPARQREAFVLRAWQGMDVKNTAQAMQCSQGSVKTHYSRAVRGLRLLLEEVVA